MPIIVEYHLRRWNKRKEKNTLHKFGDMNDKEITKAIHSDKEIVNLTKLIQI